MATWAAVEALRATSALQFLGRAHRHCGRQGRGAANFSEGLNPGQVIAGIPVGNPFMSVAGLASATRRYRSTGTSLSAGVVMGEYRSGFDCHVNVTHPSRRSGGGTARSER